MNKSFNLEFNELSDNLIQTKIDEYITSSFHNHNYDEDESLEELLENTYKRNDARDDIEKHFPMYF